MLCFKCSALLIQFCWCYLISLSLLTNDYTDKSPTFSSLIPPSLRTFASHLILPLAVCSCAESWLLKLWTEFLIWWSEVLTGLFLTKQCLTAALILVLFFCFLCIQKDFLIKYHYPNSNSECSGDLVDIAAYCFTAYSLRWLKNKLKFFLFLLLKFLNHNKTQPAPSGIYLCIFWNLGLLSRLYIFKTAGWVMLILWTPWCLQHSN